MANHKAAALVVASLLVVVALADGRPTVAHERFLGASAAVKGVKAVSAPTLTCNDVHGVEAGETCFSVARASGLSNAQFLSFNPNINCASVFVGQWVCVDASSA